MSSGLLIIPGSPRAAPKPRTPGLRLVENFFQRWFFLVLPVVIMAGIGVLMTQRVTPEYLASATISTSANPLVDPQEIRGASIGNQETPAQATARVINERLGTDRFADGVGVRAGLADALENEFVTYDDLRQSLSIFAVGESLVDVDATWADPETSLRLVDAAIEEYLSVLQATVSADALSAVDFYEDRRAEAAETLAVAEAEVQGFLDLFPARPVGAALPIEAEFEFEQLNLRVADAQGDVDSADSAIEGARLSVLQAESEAGRRLEIVDPATSTFEPESTLVGRATILVGFMILGLLVALTILLLSTHLDRSVRSAGDIEAAGGGVTVAVVPRIKALRQRKRRVRRALDGVRHVGQLALSRGERAA